MIHEKIQCIAGKIWTGKGAVQELVLHIESGRIKSVEPLSGGLPAGAVRVPEEQLIVPGFHDAHLHLCMGGLMMGWVNFDGVSTQDEFMSRLREYLKEFEREPGQWIQGRGLDETKIEIDLRDIDAVCADIPVFIWSHDLHSAVANTAALAAAGIWQDVKDPAGGRFERDANQALTGVLRETAAHAVNKHIPSPSTGQSLAALHVAQQQALALGITAASASVREDLLPAYRLFCQDAAQKIRLNVWKVSPKFELEQDRFQKVESDRFRLATLKGFTDGALGSRSAAFWQPYADDPENSGIALVREGPLARYVRAAHGGGFQVALHAIGDRANSICLDAFEMSGSGGRGPEYRPRIEHCQVLRERDIGRFAELGVIASMQPIHCTADMPFTEKRIGRDRCKYSYAWKSLKRSGAILAFGSDWPVEDLDPLAGLHAAVTRQMKTGVPQGGWEPQERLSVAEALEAYTMGAAYAANWESNIGSLEAGKYADFVVLSRNVFEIAPKEIVDTRVVKTVVEGEVVFEGGGMKKRMKDEG